MIHDSRLIVLGVISFIQQLYRITKLQISHLDVMLLTKFNMEQDSHLLLQAAFHIYHYPFPSHWRNLSTSVAFAGGQLAVITACV